MSSENYILLAALAINAFVTIMVLWRTSTIVGTIEVLEKNTNSIKDALVKVTGESEHAKGVLQGMAAATALRSPKSGNDTDT